MNLLKWQDIFVETESGKQLRFGNAAFTRTVDLSRGFPCTVSLCDASGNEFAAPDKVSPDCSFVGMDREQAVDEDYVYTDVSAEVVAGSIFEAEHVLIQLRFRNTWCEADWVREYRIYPRLAAHGVRCRITPSVLPKLYWNYRSLRNAPEQFQSYGCVEVLRPAAGLRARETVEFRARTDYRDELVICHPASAETSGADGNLLYLEREDRTAGLAILQEAMPSEERRDVDESDFRFENGEIGSCCWGIAPYEVKPGEEIVSVRNAVLLYHSELERETVLKDYLALRFPMTPDKYAVTVNPWGCGAFPQHTSPEFLVDEIRASAECNADYYQIDDSWQQGSGLGEMLSNRRTGMDFWAISRERMGGTFAPQLKAAADSGIRLALWTAPTMTTGFADWREYAELLLKYHCEYGFDLFKIDGVVMHTYESERNLEKILRFVREKSGGKVYFNLDTTNGQRAGYFLFLEYGNIFLENRYLCHEWSIGYHPDKTLRSLWELTRYLRPQTLQIEIPAPEQLNPALYRKINREEPVAYPYEYWAAIALFANPLLWFAPSLISAEHRAAVGKMMALHKKIRQEIFAGHVFPVGKRPGEGGLTGFLADAGYLLVFRQRGVAETAWLLDEPCMTGAWASAELLSGKGAAQKENGAWQVKMPEQGSYALFRLK